MIGSSHGRSLKYVRANSKVKKDQLCTGDRSPCLLCYVNILDRCTSPNGQNRVKVNVGCMTMMVVVVVVVAAAVVVVLHGGGGGWWCGYGLRLSL